MCSVIHFATESQSLYSSYREQLQVTFIQTCQNFVFPQIDDIKRECGTRFFVYAKWSTSTICASGILRHSHYCLHSIHWMLWYYNLRNNGVYQPTICNIVNSRFLDGWTGGGGTWFPTFPNLDPIDFYFVWRYIITKQLYSVDVYKRQLYNCLVIMYLHTK